LADKAGAYGVSYPHSAWAEQDPDEVRAAAIGTLAALVRDLSPDVRSRIVGLGLSGIMHTLLAVSGQGTPLVPAMIWADTRATAEAAQAKSDLDEQAVYERTGCPIHPMYAPAKLLWLRSHRPDVFTEARYFCTLKEYVACALIGECVVDRGIASASGMVRLLSDRWDEGWLDYIGIAADRLFSLEEGTASFPLLPEPAAATGLPAGLPVVLGSSDGVLASLGLGAVDGVRAAGMIGSSGAVRVAVRQPRTDPQRRTWCLYLAQECWIVGSSINNGGIVYQWAQETFGLKPDSPTPSGHPRLEDGIAQMPVGTEGLLFLPFLAGERCPYWNADARGVMVGLGRHHRPEHMARAAMEGVALRMKSVHQAVEDVCGRTPEVRVSGGFVASPVWLQMVADALGRELVLTTEEQASAFGAALLAFIAQGVLADLDAAAALVQTERRVLPRAAEQQRWDELFAIYLDTYWALQEQFAAIARLQRELI